MVENPVENHDPIYNNAISLQKEVEWFIYVLNGRLSSYISTVNDKKEAFEGSGKTPEAPIVRSTRRWSFSGKSNVPIVALPQLKEHIPVPVEMPDFSSEQSNYAEFVRHYQMTQDERLVLILTLIPYLNPELLDVFFVINPKTGIGYTEFGGLKGTRHGGFLPTIETAMFLAGGSDLAKRITLQKLFEPDHFFTTHNILAFNAPPQGEPSNSTLITVNEEYLDFFTQGTYRKPQFGVNFPAKNLKSQLDWNDLILDAYTSRQLEEINIWLRHHHELMHSWGMKRILKPGYKALFYGPSGTGKTLAATLLGKRNSLEVYKIDLSSVVSKYIGETEKNLEQVFSKAENKNWILFFDEADSLFGKRSNISEAHDKYANQEISYLLQRLEDYSGLVILASNMRQNIDEAFSRRLQSIIQFSKPQANERFKIWKNSFSASSQLENEEILNEIAQHYDLTGGNIINVVQYASLMAIDRGQNLIKKEDLIDGIRKEYLKEGKTI